jgi:hypothetical protein
MLIRPTAREDRPLIDIAECRNPKRLELGIRLHEQGRYQRAAKVFASLDTLIRPHPEARYFHALCLNELGNTKRAIELMETVVRDRPRMVGALYNLAYLQERQGNRREAEIYYRRTLAMDPTFVSAWINLGNVLIGRGEWPEGADAYGQAMRLAPRSPQPLVNLAHTRLLLGDYQSGWRLYHERWNLPDFRARNGLTAPNAGKPWIGQDIAGKRLVVFREQGTGDVIQMLRYDEALRAKGAEIIWRVPTHLFRLARASVPSDVVTDVERLPDHEYIVPVMSLPMFCGTSGLATIPGAEGYLRTNEGDQHHSFTRGPGLNVGVAWAGSAVHKRDTERSLGLEAMSSLFSIPGCSFVNLQFGDREAEGDAHGLKRVDVSDYYDTALVLQQLDLVIACDTSIVHLAGALRVPCWVMVTAIPDFRWLLVRPDSPWYRSVAIYRQPTAGDWAAVIAEVKEHLTQVSQRER